MIPRGKKSSILQRWREQGSASATEEEIATLLAMPFMETIFIAS